MPTSRRTFLKLLTTGALSATFPASIQKALAVPANHRTGSIADVEHIVILMQENRSFDHYFGTMRGVRGFGDPRAIQLLGGRPVWYQPHGEGHVLPFHPGAPNLGLQFLEDLPHDWTTTHGAWNHGHYDQWIPNKGATTMAHLVRSDIPYHYALADAFTICDAYYCSLMGPTDPNRYHMWSGWVGNDGQGNGPVVDNSEAGYLWTTYPERLEEAGISWKVYQDIGTGLNEQNDWGSAKDAYIGNYGDNALLYFRRYQSAQPGHPLYEKAKTGTNILSGGTLFDHFREDVRTGRLPQVSWVVAPEAYTEHPNWPANYGAWYISQILEALTANPEVWSKTAFFLTYDENDGFFDHMVPPTPPLSREHGLSTVDTAHEIFPGGAKQPKGPYGLGVRVPMIVISPWSKGGWVNSEVFDHTSVVRFIEQRFGVEEPNITPWRRAVCGDLTSAFDFKAPNHAVVSLPSTVAYLPPDNQRYPDYKPASPVEQAMPVQEPGVRPARAVPYELHVQTEADARTGVFRLHFGNTGKSAAVFQVRSGNEAHLPRTYTVGPQQKASDNWTADTYELSVYGPNGFFRAYKGSLSSGVESSLEYDVPGDGVVLHLRNQSGEARELQVMDAYTKKNLKVLLHPGEEWQKHWRLKETHGWYDFVMEAENDPGFRHQFAGHLETGRDSISDPAFGKKSSDMAR
jgi:phospholipase C